MSCTLFVFIPNLVNVCFEQVATANCNKNAEAINRRTRQTLWGGCADANPKLLPNDT